MIGDMRELKKNPTPWCGIFLVKLCIMNHGRITRCDENKKPRADAPLRMGPG